MLQKIFLILTALACTASALEIVKDGSLNAIATAEARSAARISSRSSTRYGRDAMKYVLSRPRIPMGRNKDPSGSLWLLMT